MIITNNYNKGGNRIKNFLILGFIVLLIGGGFSPSFQATNQHHNLDNGWSYNEYNRTCLDKEILFDRIEVDNYNSFHKEFIFSGINNNNNHFYDLEENQCIFSNNELVISSDDTGLMDSCWPMKAQNIHHTGLSPYSTKGNNGVVQWSYKTPGWIEGGSIIDEEGVIYFGDFDHYFYAMYPNGTLKWKKKLNGDVWSTPAIAEDGTIYIGTYGVTLFAIHHNGTIKWEFKCGGSISSSPVIDSDGSIYFGTMGPGNIGRIYSIYPNGTEKWHYNTGSWIVSDPAVADDGTIYIGSSDYYFYAMNPNGSLKWRFKTGDIVKSHPSIAEDGTVYFDSFDGYLYALNPNGTLKWKIRGVLSGCASASIDNNGIIYSGGRTFDAVYPNGTRKWRYTFGEDYHSSHSSPALSADGTIYIGVTYDDVVSGYIYALNKESGALLWRKKIANDWAQSSPCIGVDGTVYIGSSSSAIGRGSYGVLYAFGRNTSNQPPIPPEIYGSTRGKPSQSYAYNFTVNDPDLDNVELFIDWGDGDNSGWLGPYDSGTVISLYHTWSEKGNYLIHTKARDTYDGSESSWSTLSITMPKNKIDYWNFLDCLSDFLMWTKWSKA